MDIQNITVDFGSKKKVNLPSIPLNRPERRRVREKFVFSPHPQLLFTYHSLVGISRILENNESQRYNPQLGFSKQQWCDIFDKQVRKAKPFLDD